MKPPPFALSRPDSVDEVLSLLAEHGDDVKVLAGGQSLVPILNFRLARPSLLVDINRVSSLAGFRREGHVLRIGALTRHRAIELGAGPTELADYGFLADVARWIGHYPIRTRGTFGGSVAHGDPAAEWPMIVCLLDGEIVAQKHGSTRTIAAADFFESFLATTLEPDELVTEVRLPTPPARFAIREFSRRHGDFALAAVAVAVMNGSAGPQVRIAAAGAGPRPLRAASAEAVLTTSEPTSALLDEAAAAVAADAEPFSDVHGSADYRRHLLRVLSRRAFDELWPVADGSGSVGR